MRFIKRKKLTSGQKQEIFELWNNEYPRNLKYNDIAELNEYLSKLEDQNHILLIDDNGKIEGWYSDFIRDQERWFLAILNSKIQGKKFGTQILNMAKEANEELKGWVINSDNYIKTNGQPYKSPTDFYKKQGFQILEETKLETNRSTSLLLVTFRAVN